jgi:hypothetical protein
MMKLKNAMRREVKPAGQDEGAPESKGLRRISFLGPNEGNGVRQRAGAILYVFLHGCDHFGDIILEHVDVGGSRPLRL